MRASSVLQTVGLGAAVLVGAGTQRVTGMGFALMVSPFTVLLLGPYDGVLVVNLCGAVTALSVLTQVWRDVDVRTAALLLGPAVVAVFPGAWVAHHLPAPVLAIGVGGLVLLALGTVLISDRARLPQGPAGAIAAGAGSGFMNVTAGVGGPAIAVYAVSTGWAQRPFAATAQLIFGVLSLVSLAVKGGRPSLSAAGWATAVAALVAGIVAGSLLAGRVRPEQARRAVLTLALVGAALAVVKGFVDL